MDWEEFLSQCKPQKNNKELLLLTGDRQKVLQLYLLPYTTMYTYTAPFNQVITFFS